MSTAQDILWTPSSARQDGSELARYRRGLKDYDGGADYLDLWRWSTCHLGRFWGSVAAFEDVRLGGSPTGPVAPREMPGGTWFPGRTVNYAEHVLRRCPDEALVVVDDDGTSHQLSRAELRSQVAAVSVALRRMGVAHGDRVAAVLPNRAEADGAGADLPQRVEPEPVAGRPLAVQQASGAEQQRAVADRGRPLGRAV